MRVKVSSTNISERLLTSQVSNAEIVTACVYVLGGASKSIDTEDVAIEAHRIAPERFSWRKHQAQVNLELVRVSLSDAKKVGRRWLAGSGNEGWTLTAAGLVWARANAELVCGSRFQKARSAMRSGAPEERRWRAEHARIIALHGWQKWNLGGRVVTQPDACEVFRIDSYAVGNVRMQKVSRVLALFEADGEMSEFLRAAATAIPDSGV